MIIGITGSISTGKSIVTNYLIECGYQVIDADKLAKEELNKPDVMKEIITWFGEEILMEGRINRKLLGQIIFQDEKSRNALNNIIHPRVIKRIQDRINKDEEIVFVDIPLLYETHLENLVDKVIVVYTSLPTQVSRLMKRDNIDENYAQIKIGTQINIELKKQKADYLINNEYDLDNTYLQIKEIIRRIQNEI